MKLAPTPQTYSELQQAFTHFNRELFDGLLPDCLITLQRERKTMGYFHPKRFVDRQGHEVHEIALNPSYFAASSVEVVLSTLVHEMAHVWQFEHGTPGRRGYHNREWADQMISIGLYPSSTGEVGGKEVGEKMADYIVEGGRFIGACRRLLDHHFKLSWYDRFLPNLDTPPPRPTGLVAPEGSSQAPSVLTPPPALVAGHEFEPPKENRSNRSKYECTGECKAHVWGKSGLLLKCMECDAEMVEL